MIPADSIPISSSSSARTYWIAVFLFILALVVATVIITLQGGHANVRARTITPAPGSTVSVRPPIRVQFTRPIDRASVEGAVTISPEIPFDLNWVDNQLRIVPHGPLQAETTYTVTVGPGVQDFMGVTLEGQLQWQFRTRQPRIAFIRSAADGTSELWLTNLDGEGEQRISSPGQVVLDFDAAPDGSSLVYAVSEGENTTNLWRANLGQQGLTRLTDEEGIMYGAPRFSPGGDLVAVEVRPEVAIGDQGSTLAPPRLELRRPVDGSPAGVIYGTGPEIGHSPRWSPDGTRLAFYEPNAISVGIFNFTADLQFFPAESAALGAQAWSSDSRALVYTSIHLTEQGAQQVLAVRDLQLGTESIHREPAGDQADPAWSPDGSLIAYAYQPPPGMDSAAGIWYMRPDGTGKVLLVMEPGMLYWQPAWSPDGEWLLFGRFDLNDPGSSQGLWAVRRNGMDLHHVADDAFQPVWVP
jgi:Tol biopolymer transport system component